MSMSARVSVLIVEDQRVSAAVTQAILLKLGFLDVDAATSATDALDRLRVKRYDVVLVDWHMPDVDGPEFIRRMRGLGLRAQPTLFFLTADTSWARLATARDLGVDRVIFKASRPNELMHNLSRALRGAAPEAFAATC